MRDLTTLPKTHLHLHFTGSMRPTTLAELASEQGMRLPPALLEGRALRVPPNQRGWFRFQRLYDAARAVVSSEATMRRILREAVEDDAAEGSRRLEIQIDPTSYGPWVGGITPALEIVLDEARSAARDTGVEVGVIVACSRTRHSLDGRTLARLAANFAGDQPGEVIGFGLSNDERSGVTSDWAKAFSIARRAGLASLPHGGELLGADHVRDVLTHLGPTRLGHGVRLAEDLELLEHVVADGIGLELAPSSNVALGVFSEPGQVPLHTLARSGALLALSADDPLLFGSRLLDQYEIARHDHGMSDAQLADLARGSVTASLASQASKQAWLQEIDEWLAAPA